MVSRRGCWGLVIGLSLGLAAVAARAERVPQLDSARYSDPLLEIPPPVRRFDDDLQTLWIAALLSHETDLKQEAAFALAWSHRRGLAVTDAAIEALLKNLADPQISVRLTAAQTLAVLDARRAAEALFQRLGPDGLEMSQLVEPALARWDYPAARPVWRDRLRDPAAQPTARLLAIRCLGQVRDPQALGQLRELAAASAEPADQRLEAARAAGQIAEEGGEDTARRLVERAGGEAWIERLIAAHLLRKHSSPAACDLLHQLAQDSASSVAGVALERLVEVDPDRILPLADDLLARGDANVRRLVAAALRARPTPEGLGQLARLLSDPHPDLRVFAADALCELAASDTWRGAVLVHAEQALGSEDWRALEQALRMLAKLDRKPLADRCLPLLAHPRPEVYVTAAWSLRRLGVSSTLDPALEFARQLDQRRRDGQLESANDIGIERQMIQLLELFGQQRYAPAIPFLRTFVPKTLDIPEARGAAVWALGYLYEDQPDDELAGQLEARLRDSMGLSPECPPVRYFSAISLGRMGAREALPALRAFGGEGTATQIGYACAWSIQRLTGEPYEQPIPLIRYHTNFFLEPVPQR